MTDIKRFVGEQKASLRLGVPFLSPFLSYLSQRMRGHYRRPLGEALHLLQAPAVSFGSCLLLVTRAFSPATSLSPPEGLFRLWRRQETGYTTEAAGAGSFWYGRLAGLGGGGGGLRAHLSWERLPPPATSAGRREGAAPTAGRRTGRRKGRATSSPRRRGSSAR